MPNFVWQDQPVWLEFDVAIEWLESRVGNHVAWLDDYSMYVNLRFDSRTGCVLIKHDIDDTYLAHVLK